MNFKTCLWVLIFLSGHLPGFTQNLEWVKNMGSPETDIGYDLARDQDGNIYSTGIYYGLANFNPNSPGPELNIATGPDIFIQKTDPDGNFLWVKGMGGSGYDFTRSIEVDLSGNVTAVGFFSETVDFDPGTGVFNLTASAMPFNSGIFVQKLDTDGNFLWALSIGAPQGFTGDAHTHVLDAAGNIYVIGRFTGSADFDPGDGVFNLSSSGGFDFFVLKLDANGSFIWAKSIGGIGIDFASSLVLDNTGNIIMTGSFKGTVDFDPGPGTFSMTTNALSYSGFILKLAPDGNFIWAKNINSVYEVQTNALTLDQQGNIYTTGAFVDVTDFDPGPEVYNLTDFDNFGYMDAFILKLDADGNFTWVVTMGGVGETKGNSIATDIDGNVYTTGTYGYYFFGPEEVDFDPGPGEYYLSNSSGEFDMYVQKLDANGNFIWAHGIGNGNLTWEEGHKILVDQDRNLYLTGSFEKGDFNPGSEINSPQTNGPFTNSDIFILKWSQCVTTSTMDIFTCEDYSLNGQTYTESGTYTQTTANSSGCDNVLILNLTIVPIDTSVTRESTTLTSNTLGANYTWVDCNQNFAPIPGATGQSFTPTVSGNYAVIVAQNGCVETSACYFVCLSTTSTLDITTCEEDYTLNGEIYNESGVYTQTLTNSGGCDSVLTLHLTIEPVDASVTQEAATLTANTAGALYQWVDCNQTFEPISGENGQSFTPTVSGDYAVVVIQNGCPAISDCYSVTVVGTEETPAEANWLVYPNPTSGKLTIAVPEGGIDGIAIEIRNALGQLVHKEVAAHSDVLHANLDLPSGVYAAIIQSGKRQKVVNLVIQ